MARLTLDDLPARRTLDRPAMACIRGAGGAPWVFGAFRAYVPASARVLPVVNVYQTNNIFVAEQLNVQFQTIDVDVTATQAVVSVFAAQRALNVDIG